MQDIKKVKRKTFYRIIIYYANLTLLCRADLLKFIFWFYLGLRGLR